MLAKVPKQYKIKILVIHLESEKIKISANQEQLNVVGFLSSFVLLVSLSLTSLLSRPVFHPGEAVVESLAPTRICEWAEGSFIMGDLSRGEGRFIFSIHRRFFSRVRAAARGAQPRGGSRFPNSFARRPPGLRRDHRGPVRRRQLPAPKPADSHGGARRTWSSARTILSH